MLNASNLLGQLMKSGLGGGGESRLQRTLGDQGLGGQGGIDQLLGNFFGNSGGAMGGASGSGGLGGLMQSAQNMLSGSSPAAVGGIGALAGALLGGGKGSFKGALGGGALALLGTMAVSALQNRGQNQQAAPGQAAAPTQASFEPSQHEIQQMQSEETAQLLVEAMIMAAKSDGEIQDDEMQRIVGTLDEGGITDEERQFVLGAMRNPIDIDRLARQVTHPGMAAEVYAASLFAIEVDTQAERDYLQQLATSLGLHPQTVAQIHQMTGVSA